MIHFTSLQFASIGLLAGLSEDARHRLPSLAGRPRARLLSILGGLRARVPPCPSLRGALHVFSLHYSLQRSLHCAVCSVHYALCGRQSSACSARCALCWPHCARNSLRPYAPSSLLALHLRGPTTLLGIPRGPVSSSSGRLAVLPARRLASKLAERPAERRSHFPGAARAPSSRHCARLSASPYLVQ